jgi:hypothetical protein
MIEKIEMHTAVCDGCKDMMELFSGAIAMIEKSSIEEEIKESYDWHLLSNGKVYCPDCHMTE